MAEVTAFGKCLRKMRIDSCEVLGAMARRLGISPAYLSSIENGGREIPDGLAAKIAAEYGLDESRAKELEEAEARTKGEVAVRLGTQKCEPGYVETAVMFARDFSKLSGAQIEELKNLLKAFEGSGADSNGSKSA